MTNPTPEQIEAAYQAWLSFPHKRGPQNAENAIRAALVAAAGVPVSGSTSDGHHTFDELYDYRMLYNAHAAHGWLAAGIPVVKSWKHSDSELCFGGGWFIVTATLPTGQVSNHYKAEHWELFAVPEVDLPPEYDGHTPQDAAERLRAAAGAAPKKPAEGVGHREKLVGTCGHSEYCNHRFRLWDRLTHHSNGSRMRGKGSPNEASRVDVVFDWLESEGFVLAAPVQVDEAKLAEVIGWEAPGWDNRKELASLFQDHCAIPDEMTLESIYPALIAVAGCGYELAKEHVLAAAAEHSRGGGR